MKLYYLSSNKMENSNKLIFWCLFMVLHFLGLIRVTGGGLDSPAIDFYLTCVFPSFDLWPLV